MGENARKVDPTEHFCLPQGFSLPPTTTFSNLLRLLLNLHLNFSFSSSFSSSTFLFSHLPLLLTPPLNTTADHQYSSSSSSCVISDFTHTTDSQSPTPCRYFPPKVSIIAFDPHEMPVVESTITSWPPNISPCCKSLSFPATLCFLQQLNLEMRGY